MKYILALFISFSTYAATDTSLYTFKSQIVPNSQNIQVVLFHDSSKKPPANLLGLMKVAEKKCKDNKIDFRKIDVIVEPGMAEFKSAFPRIMVSFQNHVLLDIPDQPIHPGSLAAFINALKLVDKEMEPFRKKPL